MIAEKDAGALDVNQRLVKLCDGDAKRDRSFSLSADRPLRLADTERISWSGERRVCLTIKTYSDKLLQPR
ncbi:hypothetical protein NDK50_23910 [Paraburkholderia bryophila]|uniref:hypothetical protein n=1 Tax=Paraburkholderia bryophila TaxID=420952 RepID=UPI0023491EEA|nr:hypothetical protein [Paraburkholderia bryophila]WCM23893.1 hypothetical protein NDK50_23910 [Paraburkholderia bryophila]